FVESETPFHFSDSSFLLRFLRSKKFCLPLAQEMLEKYLAIRQLYPQWFRRLDITDPILSEIYDNGYLIPLPRRDEFWFAYGSHQPLVTPTLIFCPLLSIILRFQISGYCHVNDESGLLMGHISLWSLSDIRNMSRCIQNSTPIRHKATHFINVPSYAAKVFEFITSCLSEKLKKRVYFHSNLSSFHKIMDPKILPKEYGGEIPMAQMIADYKEKLLKKRELLLDLDNLKITINKKAKYVTEMQDQDITGLAGSFRKLEVD
ncbi:retinaldehyde-binding protein 1-like, partial [Diaphorina citri]|uniref:Retinaldehyde-binding protein 1-like n=1 Tax=Diaphorina citri TaxID=121845 RepID=A0A3Q0J7W1_DIACI